MESLDQITGYLDFDLQCQISGKEYAADELTALMCRREVRAFMEGKALMEWVGPVIIYLKGQYESQIILNAIEQVKKEMK